MMVDFVTESAPPEGVVVAVFHSSFSFVGLIKCPRRYPVCVCWQVSCSSQRMVDIVTGCWLFLRMLWLHYLIPLRSFHRVWYNKCFVDVPSKEFRYTSGGYSGVRSDDKNASPKFDVLGHCSGS